MKARHPIDWLPVLLGLLFIHHKLLGTIDWSWWIVLAPFWILFALSFLSTFIIGVIRGFRSSWIAQRDARGGGGSKL